MKIEALIRVSPKTGKSYFEVHPRAIRVGEKYISTSGHRSVRDPSDDHAEVRVLQEPMTDRAVALSYGKGPHLVVSDEIELKQFGRVYLDVWFDQNGIPDDGAAITMCTESAGKAKAYRVLSYSYGE